MGKPWTLRVELCVGDGPPMVVRMHGEGKKGDIEFNVTQEVTEWDDLDARFRRAAPTGRGTLLVRAVGALNSEATGDGGGARGA